MAIGSTSQQARTACPTNGGGTGDIWSIDTWYSGTTQNFTFNPRALNIGGEAFYISFVIPEPSRAVLFALGFAMTVLRRRR